jgi:hypothetical protein
MSKWSPCKRRDFIRKLRKLGFQGPYTGTRHQFMVWKQHRMAIPSNDEYSIPQLKMMLLEVTNIIGEEISIGEWARAIESYRYGKGRHGGLPLRGDEFG